MPHQRQLIREAVTTLLTDAATDAGANVFPSRYVPLRRSEMPALSVLVNTENVQQDSWETAPVLLVREPVIEIQGWVEAVSGTDIDDSLDDLGQQVEDAIHADEFLNATVDRCRLSTVEKEVTREGDRLVGVIVMQFVARYSQYAEASAPALDDFLTANVSHDLGADEPEVDSVSVQE